MLWQNLPVTNFMFSECFLVTNYKVESGSAGSDERKEQPDNLDLVQTVFYVIYPPLPPAPPAVSRFIVHTLLPILS